MQQNTKEMSDMTQKICWWNIHNHIQLVAPKLSEIIKLRGSCSKFNNNISGCDCDEICAICLENLNYADTAIIDSCAHIGHHECLTKNYTISQKCPCCRNTVEGLISCTNGDKILYIEKPLVQRHLTNIQPHLTRVQQIQLSNNSTSLLPPSSHILSRSRTNMSVPLRRNITTNIPHSQDPDCDFLGEPGVLKPNEPCILQTISEDEKKNNITNSITLFESGDNSNNLKLLRIINNQPTYGTDTIFAPDVSGSMINQIKNIAQICTYFINKLNQESRVAILPWDNNAYCLMGLKQMTPDNKTHAIELFSKLGAYGGTEVIPFLNLLKELLNTIDLTVRPVNVIIYTDGESSDSREMLNKKLLEIHNQFNVPTIKINFIVISINDVHYEHVKQLCVINSSESKEIIFAEHKHINSNINANELQDFAAELFESILPGVQTGDIKIIIKKKSLDSRVHLDTEGVEINNNDGTWIIKTPMYKSTTKFLTLNNVDVVKVIFDDLYCINKQQHTSESLNICKKRRFQSEIISCYYDDTIDKNKRVDNIKNITEAYSRGTELTPELVKFVKNLLDNLNNTGNNSVENAANAAISNALKIRSMTSPN